jgi:hypothetical protein
MKLCARCGKPDFKKHFCLPDEPRREIARLAPVVHEPKPVDIASPNAVHASPNASPNKTGSRNARWRSKNAAAYREYMRSYMKRKRAAHDHIAIAKV